MNKGIFYLSFDVEFKWGRRHLKNYKEFVLKIRKEEKIIKEILIMLKKYHIRATFAIVGNLFDEKPELISLIKENGHEIASHSLTHADFAKIDRSEAELEIRESIELARKYGFRLKSFVFPFNHVAYLDLLKKYGFKTHRDSKTPMYFASNRKKGKLIPRGWRFRIAKYRIDKAARSDGVFHLWTHPIDLIDPSLFKEFEQILVYVSKLQKEKKINVATMY